MLKNILTLLCLITFMIIPSLAATDESQPVEPLKPFIERVANSTAALPDERKQKLAELADYIVKRIGNGEKAKLVFICTHNSRRSQFAQVLCETAAAYYQVPVLEAFSGGTEVTACNVRTVRALRRVGYSVVASTTNENPLYLVQYSESKPPICVHSKLYSADGNPGSEFAAVMCCADADENCPLVAGADVRFRIVYEDPKTADNTPQESQRYDERCVQIAREMFFLMSEVSRRTRAQ
jgi:hypothetical protein